MLDAYGAWFTFPPLKILREFLYGGMLLGKCFVSCFCILHVFWKLTPRHIYLILPRNLTWNLKIMVSKRNLLFQGLLFRFHVQFQGCSPWSPLPDDQFILCATRRCVARRFLMPLHQAQRIDHEDLTVARRNDSCVSTLRSGFGACCFTFKVSSWET